MRILVLIHEFPPVGGGGGRAAEDICRELAERGHEIKVLTARVKGLPREEGRDGFHVLRLHSARTQSYRAGFFAMAFYVLAGLWAGLRLIKRWRPDVIHVHFAVPAGALAWMLSRMTGIPYLLTVHLGDVPGGVPEKTNGWFRFVYPFTPPIWHDAGRVVAVSRHTRELAENHYRVHMEIIPNGIDLSLRNGGLHTHHPPRIMFAGRFVTQKNPLQVVETLAGLKDLEWECVMMGDGPLLEDVRRRIATHKMEERFTLPGWVTPQDVLHWFGKGDLLFMPSLSEGLPVVGLQALVKGLAIVASRAGGFVDLVEDHKNGYLVELEGTPGFSALLQELLSDRERLLSFRKASLEKVKSFDIAKIAERYESILQEIVRSKY
jgi:glycosyltransferase involved in cell wall biosynthesis